MDANTPPAEAAPRPVRYWISLALVAAVIFVYVLLMTRRTPSPLGTVGPAIGRRLEVLELQPLTGDAQPVSSSDLAGRVTLVNYWGTWCPPCIREFPDIVEILERYGDRDDFRLYAVSCGQGSDPEIGGLRDETETFLASRGASLPTYADQEGVSRQAMTLLLGVPMGYPTTLVLDRDGVIRGFWQGYVPRAADEMAAMIEELLAEPAS